MCKPRFRSDIDPKWKKAAAYKKEKESQEEEEEEDENVSRIKKSITNMLSRGNSLVYYILILTFIIF